MSHLPAIPDNRLSFQQSPSITEVAMQCGFSNVTSFNRCFRQLKHTSPSEYRHQLSVVVPKASA